MSSPVTNAPPPSADRDRLTIGRLLLLTAGVAVGLGAFGPGPGDQFPPPRNELMDWSLAVANAFLIGLSLPAPWFVIRIRTRHGRTPGMGGMFALTAALGALTMLPPVVMTRGASPRTSLVCLYYVLPLMGLWYVLAALVGGQIRSIFRRETPWLDRYGGWLALLWSPLGLWHLFHFYAEAF